jgi:hypothetical protein
MIKIKLQENKTLQVNRELVAQLEATYKLGFIKLIQQYLQDELEETGNKYYVNLLDLLEKEFPQQIEQGANRNLPFTADQLLSAMNSSSKEGRSLRLTNIPIDNVIAYFESDAANNLQSFLRGRMNVEDAIKKIKSYFRKRKTKHLGINMELQRAAEKSQRIAAGEDEEDPYSGLYLDDIGAVSIVFEAAFFMGSVITNREGRRLRLAPRLSVDAEKRPETIIGFIKDELADLPVSVRHELQHFYQSIFSAVFGAEPYAVGNVPKSVSRAALGKEPDLRNLPHYMQPVEMQTDIQDDIDKFHLELNKFREKNARAIEKEPKFFKDAIKIMMKVITATELSPSEKNFFRSHKLDHYTFDVGETFRQIKSTDKSGKLYNYALTTLYNSVRDEIEDIDKLTIPVPQRYGKGIEENIIMDKIKVILKEGTLINEEMSKDELRKIIRDEFEKMLRDKETKKEIAKITKEFMKKFYRELSFSSTHVIDQVDV